jgi:phosphoglycerate dehydrogenase-like enzyme
MNPHKIWANNLLSEAARDLFIKEIGAERLILQTVGSHWLIKGEPDPQMREAYIVYGQPDPENVLESTGVRWVHVTSAGYTRYDTERFRNALLERGTMFTNSSSVYSEPCAQHAVAFILADARELYPAFESQRTHRDWPTAFVRSRSRLLNYLNILILGYGHIGRRIAELLRPFKVNVVGFRRNPQNEAGIIGESELDSALAGADIVVNVLPENDSTRGFFNESRFDGLKDGVRYVSIGRGVTTDPKALETALKRNQVAAAYLDVTEPEPLPPDHPLWTTPNCYITPHCSGGHDNEDIRLVEHFLTNLRRFERREPLLDRVF